MLIGCAIICLAPPAVRRLGLPPSASCPGTLKAPFLPQISGFAITTLLIDLCTPDVEDRRRGRWPAPRETLACHSAGGYHMRTSTYARRSSYAGIGQVYAGTVSTRGTAYMRLYLEALAQSPDTFCSPRRHNARPRWQAAGKLQSKAAR